MTSCFVCSLRSTERAGDLRFVAAALRERGQTDHRGREAERRHFDVAEGRAGAEFVRLRNGDDHTRARFVDRLQVVREDFEELRDFKAFAGTDERNVRAGLQDAAVNANVVDLLDEGVDAGLENLRDDGAFRIGDDFDVFAVGVLRDAGDRVGREGVSGERVEEFGHPDAGFRRNAEDRNQRFFFNALGDQLGEFFVVREFAFEVAFHRGVVDGDDRFDELFVQFVRVDEGAGGFRRFQGADDAAEVRAATDRDVEEDGFRAEDVANVVDEFVELNVVGVHLRNDDDATQTGRFRFFEDATGVDFEARLGVDDDRGGVRGAHRADRAADEVRITGGVEDVETFAGVIEVDAGGFDRVLVRFFFVVEVANARAGVDAGRRLLQFAGNVQEGVGHRGFAGTAVTAQDNVANVSRIDRRHRLLPRFENYADRAGQKAAPRFKFAIND